MDTRVLFTLILAAVAVERLVELRISNRNARRALARGGVEAGAGHYRVMVVLHTLFLASCLAEVWWLSPPFVPVLAVVMGAALAATMALRYWAIASLGDRWNTRVICLPGLPAVRRGPYRWLRHPNYLAVVVEIIALPMIHTAWRTALLFGIANLILLRVRIRVEETALRTHADYDRVFPGPARLPIRRPSEP